jgi:hypothetical protein
VNDAIGAMHDIPFTPQNNLRDVGSETLDRALRSGDLFGGPVKAAMLRNCEKNPELTQTDIHSKTS